MGDWIGLAFIVLLIVAALVAIKVLANPRPRTSDEFERGAAENTTMAGALLNALHDITDPAAAKAMAATPNQTAEIRVAFRTTEIVLPLLTHCAFNLPAP